MIARAAWLLRSNEIRGKAWDYFINTMGMHFYFIDCWC